MLLDNVLVFAHEEVVNIRIFFNEGVFLLLVLGVYMSLECHCSLLHIVIP